MIEEEERKSIIEEAVNIAVEKAILMLPEVMSNLMREKISMQKMAKEFYEANKEFNSHKDIVATTIEQAEAECPGKSYKEVLDIATPRIKKRISAINMSDMKGMGRPGSTVYNEGNKSNGEI